MPERGLHFGFFTPCEADVNGNENREHEQGDKRRPLEQKAGHDYYEPYILRVTDPGVGPGGCELSLMLCVVKHPPGARKKQKSNENE